MATEYNWPRVRAILDEAISSERGIIIRYDTWSLASRVRSNAYKVREMLRRQSRKEFPDAEDPMHGISPYDGLVMWMRSSISRKEMHVNFHSEAEIQKYQVTYVGEEYPEPLQKNQENENLFPGQCVTLTVGQATVAYAPSFKEAWSILRQDFPCDLVIENNYDLTGLDISIL